jgi:hypothetical protein
MDLVGLETRPALQKIPGNGLRDAGNLPAAQEQSCKNLAPQSFEILKTMENGDLSFNGNATTRLGSYFTGMVAVRDDGVVFLF